MTSKMNALEKAKLILAGALFLPVEKISDDAAINSLDELDSLNFELIVVELEKCLGRDVDPIKLLEMRSVKDLAAILEEV
jgi:acyl carrier protein